jgi:uncharacterized protein related to proFAR isomerase
MENIERRYYKKLFVASVKNIYMIEHNNHHIPQLSSKENKIVAAGFTEKDCLKSFPS